MFFGGLKIHEYKEPTVPKVQLSDRCPCSDNVRDDFNRWLAAQFGNRPSIIPRGTVLVFNGSQVFMRPEDVARIGNLT